jgi:acyl-CoA thioester hydrolase
MWYVGKFDEATWYLFGMLGLTRSFLRENNRGMAGLQQNIAYKRELYAGDIVTIRSGILEFREKTFRFFHEMKNEDTGVISAVTVLVAAHIDTQVRKACPFPEEVAARGRSMIVEYDPGI